MKRLVPLVLILATSCIKLLDAEVTNPCEQDAIFGGWTFSEPPTRADAQRALHGADAYDPPPPDGLVRGGAEAVLLPSTLTGDLPFEGGYGVVEWEGRRGYDVFRIPPADVEPVPVVIPKRLCR
jgi:hypothetical protein